MGKKQIELFKKYKPLMKQLVIKDIKLKYRRSFLACVCQSKDVDHHSNVHNKRICKDGPVFLAEEVEL